MKNLYFIKFPPLIDVLLKGAILSTK